MSLDGEEKDNLFNYLFTQTPFQHAPEERKRFILGSDGANIEIAIEGNIGIQIIRYSLQAFSAVEKEVLKRFGKVFKQAYTRFLDLQKAEAQAREAQIEAALERVRAASMAMHKSQELHEVIKVVSEQLVNLGLKWDNAYFVRVLQDGNWDLYLTTPVQVYPAQIFIPYIEEVIMTSVNDAIGQGRDLFAVYSKEEKYAFVHHFFTNTPGRDTPEARKEYVLNSSWGLSLFVVKNIGLAVTNYQGVLYSDSDNGILKRFSKVFEQTYTRFLDLQKAEAQAREAQIEAALVLVKK